AGLLAGPAGRRAGAVVADVAGRRPALRRRLAVAGAGAAGRRGGGGRPGLADGPGVGGLRLPARGGRAAARRRGAVAATRALPPAGGLPAQLQPPPPGLVPVAPRRGPGPARAVHGGRAAVRRQQRRAQRPRPAVTPGGGGPRWRFGL